MARAAIAIALAFLLVACPPPHHFVDSARILGVFLSHSPSHLLIHCSVAETLARAGHNVTVLGGLPNVYPDARYHYIHIDARGFDYSILKEAINKPRPVYQRFGLTASKMTKAADVAYQHPTMQQFMRDHGAGDFDLIILGYFLNDFFLGMGGHFRCPIAISFMVRPIGVINDFIGNPGETAYVPSLFGGSTQPMDFKERVKNFIMSTFEQLGSRGILRYYTWKYYNKSHSLIHCAVADSLARAGHNVTVLGSQPNVYPRASYHYIHIDTPGIDYSILKFVINNPRPDYQRFFSTIQLWTSAADVAYQHPSMAQFMRDHRAGDFDLLLLGYLLNDFFLGIGGHFRCPIVLTFMIEPIPVLNGLIGNPGETAYVPANFWGGKQPMDFKERVKNFVISVYEQYAAESFLDYYTAKYYNKHFPSDRYPSFDEVRKNISLVFVNHHSISQGPIRPNVPALIEIGGIQIKEKPDPLPADIAKVLDDSPNGVIYFSLGSNVQGSHLSGDKAKIMFNVISKLPYKVLWKWSGTDYPGQSPNIIYKSWLPQDDILAHPNIKLFITHGGQGSVVESQYHGVPMVGIPLFGDQPANMVNVERSGFGLKVDYISMTEESLRAAIEEVLNNPKYTQTVKAFSQLYRDRPMTPRQAVNYWVDYVLRHQGARHMQSPAVHMNRWQLLSLDVMAFLALIVGAVVGAVVLLCRWCCCRKRGKAKVVGKAKKNK